MNSLDNQHNLDKRKNGLVIISTSKGYKRVELKDLNFIDIEERSLFYHLDNEVIKARCTLRTSFAKAVEPYLCNDNLFFLKPSLLINIDNIQFLDKNHIIFKNDEILYFPKKYYIEIYNEWSK